MNLNTTRNTPARASYTFLTVLFFFFLSHIPLIAQDWVKPDAREKALDFFYGRAPQKKSTAVTGSISLVYRSGPGAVSPLHIFQRDSGGLVFLAETSGEYKVIGYSESGSMTAGAIPEVMMVLIENYENHGISDIVTLKGIHDASPVVGPLLDEAGVSLNQYYHPETGGCPTGCVATAMAQLMAFYRYPAKGQGSHCYNHAKYGNICADFENTVYDWDNMSPEDWELLSFQVAVALDMDFCGGKSGSTPGNVNYTETMYQYFNYHVHGIITDSYYIKNELDHRRPVYSALPGAVGHAVIIDGYDSEGYFHINFGWGGRYNAYFMLNNNSTLHVGPSPPAGYTFGTNISGALYFAPYPVYTNPQDSLALLAIHQQFSGTTGWDITKNVVHWGGVSVMNERVIKLSLGGIESALEGTLAPEIGQLSELVYLNIYGRKIDGTVPESVFELTRLKDLAISPGTGNLRLTFPETLGNLTSLERLYIQKAGNGIIPASIGNLNKLKYLNISNNNLSGEIPVETGQLSSLIYLELNNNQLSGQIPESIGNLEKLNTLNLSGNILSGQIPASIGNLANLEYIFLESNQLSGEIPAAIGGCHKLKTLRFDDNVLEGPVPPGIGNLPHIEDMNFRSNQLTALPDEIGRLSTLRSLNAGNNKLTALPDSLIHLGMMMNFVADSNMIAILPEQFGAWPELHEINLSHNKLKEFPEELCHLTRLWHIDLSYNEIEQFPASIDLLRRVRILYLNQNEIRGNIPEFLLSGLDGNFSITDNRFIYSNIPDSDSLKFGIGKQKNVQLYQNRIKARPGDTVRLDIRDISPLAGDGNRYYWFRYPEKVNVEYHELIEGLADNPVLTWIMDENNPNPLFYCKVFNDDSPSFKWEWLGNTYFSPVLRFLNTDTLLLSTYTHDEILEEEFPESYIISSSDIPGTGVSHRHVTLVSPFDIRGELIWQASPDGVEWFDVSSELTEENLKANIIQSNEDRLVLEPLYTAFYRCKLTEGTCDPLISEPVKINPLGQVLFNNMVNVKDEDFTINIDSIEVTLPAGLSGEDFRLTIVKVDNPPPAPEGYKMGSVYDVSLSLGNTFLNPLDVKLRNINVSELDMMRIPDVEAVYFDEKLQKWVAYKESGINLTDSTVSFYTSHLTKLSWWELSHGSYTHRFTKDKVEVIYKWGTGTGEEINFQGYEMSMKGFPVHPWHNGNTDPDNGGTPAIVQDIAEYLNQVIDTFTFKGLQPSGTRFTVYLSNTGSGSLGHITAGGYARGYFTLNSALAVEVDDLKSTLAHEFMHYTQSRYMPVMLANYFFAEAHAPLADRIVWNQSQLKTPESEVHLKQAFRSAEGNKSIYDLLGESWDAATFLPVLEKFTVNPADANVSSTFLHYMRTYRDGARLDPVKVLKDVWSLQSVTNLVWRTYLNGQVQTQLNSTLGNEYADFVKYLLEGANPNFTILNTNAGNPFSNILKNAGPENNGTFTRREIYSFPAGNDDPKITNTSIAVPYLASKVIMLANHTPDRAVVVNYKRLHDPDENHAVYYGRYDFKDRKVVFHEISDSSNYAIFLDAYTEKAAREYQYTGILLLINKKCPDVISMGNTFNASFELKALPVINIDDIAYANVTDRPVHNYSDGREGHFIMEGRIDKNLPGFSYLFLLRDYRREKTMINDSTFEVRVSFTEELSINNGPDLPGTLNIGEKNQTIRYNYISGELSYTQHMISTSIYTAWYSALTDTYHDQYTRSVNDETHSLVLSDVFDFTPVKLDFLGELLQFRTNSTAETQSILKKIGHSINSTEYDKTGTVTGTRSATLESTNFNENVTVLLWIHNK